MQGLAGCAGSCWIRHLYTDARYCRWAWKLKDMDTPASFSAIFRETSFVTSKDFLITRNRIKKINASYTLEGTVLANGYKIKYLGITITNNLK